MNIQTIYRSIKAARLNFKSVAKLNERTMLHAMEVHVYVK